MTKSLDQLISEAVRLKTEYGRALEDGDYRKANESVPESEQLYRAIRGFGGAAMLHFSNFSIMTIHTSASGRLHHAQPFSPTVNALATPEWATDQASTRDGAPLKKG